MRELSGKRVTVLGLGRFGGGLAVTRWLAGQGAAVTVTDAADEAALAEPLGQLAGLDLALKLGGHDEADFTAADLVVASPAVKPNHPMLAAARAAKVEVTTEIALGVERLPTPWTFGVTGTKGKSTTAALLGRMLGVAARPGRETQRSAAAFDRDAPRGVWVLGNIGDPLIGSVDRIGPEDFVVLELSSFMLHYLGVGGWSPHVAVVTMVGADHLDWHGSHEAYLNDKRNLVRFQRENDYAVVPQSSKLGREFKRYTPAQVIEYGKRANLPAMIAEKLPGKHNRQNERAAFAAAKLFGVYPDEAQAACAGFAGLPHRLQLVAGDEATVRWVNDSIATIPEAAAAACAAFPAGKVVQIVGGRSKGLDEAPLIETLRERAKAVLLVGETAEALALKLGGKGHVCGTLEEAAKLSAELAEPGDVVLLSPGYPSYDQFANFEERGDRFAELARRTAARLGPEPNGDPNLIPPDAADGEARP